ncbi:PAS domain-containing protein [bacterium]|nr:PAS domain-containing protein [bacterium]
MIVAFAIDLSRDWFERVRDRLADRAMLVPVPAGGAQQAVHRLPASLVIMNAEPLTTAKLVDYRALCEMRAPVTVCIGPADVREQVRNDGLFVPDYWLAPEATLTEAQESLDLALEKARLREAQAAAPLALTPQLPETAPAGLASADRGLRNLLAAMAGNPDVDRLLTAYVESAQQMAYCASYCLLWEDPARGVLTVRGSQGLPPELAEHGRLAPDDAIVRWYGRNCRALTRQELSRWTDAQEAAALGQELGIFRGEVAIPLLPGGRLQGLLMLGEKVIGESYTPAELEALFALTGYVILRLENLQLQERMRHTQAYMERSLTSMRCGLITLGHDGRIAVCNPYAARLLGCTQAELEGADLRALPSPIGDLLYAACQSPEAAVVGEHVALARRQQHLRLTTSTLFGDDGRQMGAVVLLEDMSGAVEDAAAAARQETVHALTRIIGRLAHEVRTPLTAIKTYAELMSEPDDFQELARFWRDTVNPELERLDRLITEQVRLVEQPSPEFQLVQLEKIVEEAVARAAQQHEAAPPALKVVPPLPQVVADPGPTLDAFSYLMRYLYDHGTSGVGVVVEQQRKGPVPRVRVRMRVRANGVREDPADILDPLAVLQLEQGDLGPAIGKQLVDRQGGSVEAAHGEDYFEFRVSFPVTVAQQQDPARGGDDVQAPGADHR